MPYLQAPKKQRCLNSERDAMVPPNGWIEVHDTDVNDTREKFDLMYPHLKHIKSPIFKFVGKLYDTKTGTVSVRRFRSKSDAATYYNTYPNRIALLMKHTTEYIEKVPWSLPRIEPLPYTQSWDYKNMDTWDSRIAYYIK